MADDRAVLADGAEPALEKVGQDGVALALGPNSALSCRPKERQWYFCSLNFTKAPVYDLPIVGIDFEATFQEGDCPCLRFGSDLFRLWPWRFRSASVPPTLRRPHHP